MIVAGKKFADIKVVSTGEDVAAQLYDGSRHVLTAGGGVALHGRLPLHFDLFGQVHILSAPGRMSGLLGTCGAAVGLAL